MAFFRIKMENGAEWGRGVFTRKLVEIKRNGSTVACLAGMIAECYGHAWDLTVGVFLQQNKKVKNVSPRLCGNGTAARIYIYQLYAGIRPPPYLPEN